MKKYKGCLDSPVFLCYYLNNAKIIKKEDPLAVIEEIEIEYDPGRYILTQGHKKYCQCEICQRGGYRGYGWAAAVRPSTLKLRIFCKEKGCLTEDIQKIREFLSDRFDWAKLNSERVKLLAEAAQKALVGKEVEEIDFDNFSAVLEELEQILKREEEVIRERRLEQQREQSRRRRLRAKLMPRLRELWREKAFAAGCKEGKFYPAGTKKFYQKVRVYYGKTPKIEWETVKQTQYECREEQDGKTFVYVLSRYVQPPQDTNTLLFWVGKRIFEGLHKEVYIVHPRTLEDFEEPGDIDLVQEKQNKKG